MATQFPEMISVPEPIEVPIVHPVEQIPLLGDIPNYSAFQKPIIAVGKRGSAPGEFSHPKGVSIEPQTGYIYVADYGNHRIQIFSQTGDYINQFGDTNLEFPWGILIHQDSIYVTDKGDHAIFLFKLPNLTMIKRVGQYGSGREEFIYPCQIAISPNQHLYVADYISNRLQILTTDLTFIDTLQHQSMTQPVDVKFSNNEMFVLSLEDNPCIHVFTLSGEKSRSLVTNGDGMQVQRAFFFCLDRHNNIIISDYLEHGIKVFSPEGDLLHTIGQEGEEPGMFNKPTDIAIHNNNKLICISLSKLSCMQMFAT